MKTGQGGYNQHIRADRRDHDAVSERSEAIDGFLGRTAAAAIYRPWPASVGGAECVRRVVCPEL